MTPTRSPDQRMPEFLRTRSPSLSMVVLVLLFIAVMQGDPVYDHLWHAGRLHPDHERQSGCDWLASSVGAS